MAQILGQFHKIVGQPETLELFYNDDLGSLRVSINSNGQPIDLFRYSTLGVSTHVTGPNDYLASFTGKQYDATGLIYFNARYYDPIIGRFITEDPNRRGGDSWYNYCNNNPINNIDVTGRQGETAKQEFITLTKAETYEDVIVSRKVKILFHMSQVELHLRVLIVLALSDMGGNFWNSI